MIVIINGPPGIGKTTIATKLSKKLKRASVIEVDRFKYFTVDKRKATESIDLADEQMFAMMEALREDRRNLIIEYTYDSPRYFQAIVRRCKGIDKEVYAFRLRAHLDDNVRRDKRRPREIRLGTKVTQIHQRMDELGDSLGYTVESTGLSVEKTTEKIYLLINAEIGYA
jgi:tRNA uridine 5-carbamoylmethylation protein Kti12